MPRIKLKKAVGTNQPHYTIAVKTEVTELLICQCVYQSFIDNNVKMPQTMLSLIDRHSAMEITRKSVTENGSEANFSAFNICSVETLKFRSDVINKVHTLFPELVK